MKKRARKPVDRQQTAYCRADGSGKFYVIFRGNLIARDLGETKAKSLANFVTASGLNEGLRLYAEQWSGPKPKDS